MFFSELLNAYNKILLNYDTGVAISDCRIAIITIPEPPDVPSVAPPPFPVFGPPPG